MQLRKLITKGRVDLLSRVVVGGGARGWLDTVSDGLAPLHLAVQYRDRAGAATMVSLLLGAGADPNLKTAQGFCTPWLLV